MILNPPGKKGYEAVRIYGENTLELKGMPLGKTPEYVQVTSPGRTGSRGCHVLDDHVGPISILWSEMLNMLH